MDNLKFGDNVLAFREEFGSEGNFFYYTVPFWIKLAESLMNLPAKKRKKFIKFSLSVELIHFKGFGLWVFAGGGAKPVNRTYLTGGSLKYSNSPNHRFYYIWKTNSHIS